MGSLFAITRRSIEVALQVLYPGLVPAVSMDAREVA